MLNKYNQKAKKVEYMRNYYLAHDKLFVRFYIYSSLEIEDS